MRGGSYLVPMYPPPHLRAGILDPQPGPRFGQLLYGADVNGFGLMYKDRPGPKKVLQSVYKNVSVSRAF
jgi:hypothetical protein